MLLQHRLEPAGDMTAILQRPQPPPTPPAAIALVVPLFAGGIAFALLPREIRRQRRLQNVADQKVPSADPV
jgi:hypothetical protein